MILQELQLSHYRNYEEMAVTFAPGINVLIGENAQGKTNLLEAIYLLQAGKGQPPLSKAAFHLRWEPQRSFVCPRRPCPS